MITKLLVIIQFATIFLLVILSESSVLSDTLSIIVFALAVSIGLIPIFQKKFKVNVFPEATKDMKFLTNGIYKFIRHPMYLSVLLVGLSFVISDPKPILILVWLILLMNLHLKMDIEEVNMINNFPQYAEYKKSTKRLIPFIY